MATYQDIYAGAKKKVEDFFLKKTTSQSKPIPPEVTEESSNNDKDLVVQFVRGLYDDAKNYRDSDFRASQSLRTTIPGASNQDTYYDACEKLEANRLWDVVGTRRETGEEWKQERVDGEIQRQMRVRTNYLTSNWHDIEIMPNIEHINDIFDEERKKNGWSHFTKTWVKSTQKYGTSTAYLILDKTVEPNIIRPLVCKRGSIYWSPGSTDKSKLGGCWYVLKLDKVTDKTIEENYSDTIDMSILEPSKQEEKLGRTSPNTKYTYTNLYDRVQVYFDDPTLMKVEETQEEEAKIIEENLAMMDDIKVDANEREDNHVMHIMKHMEAVQNMMDVQPESEEELAETAMLVETFTDHIQKHIEMATKTDHPGFISKYPHGRYICTIGGQLAQDIPNPYLMDWRRLFFTLKNEEVVDRLDGRSDPEILFEMEKMLSTMLSRIDDMSISIAFPHPYMHIDDKKNIEPQGISSDPRKPTYFENTPPVFAKGQSPKEYFDLYAMAKQNAAKDLGVQDVTYGKSPTKDASEDLASTLLGQSEQVITGELNLNLTEAIEELVESMLDLYKTFYTEDRKYFVNGKLQKYNLSHMLKYMTVETDGQVSEEEITKLEVSVKSNSNFPNKWEQRMKLLLQFAKVVYPDGTPVVPTEFIRDELATKFPELSDNGRYAMVSQVWQLGLQAAQQIQAAEEAKKKTLDMAQQQFAKENVKALKNRNGSGQPAETQTIPQGAV